MATTSFMVANPQAVFFGDAGVTPADTTGLTKMDGLVDDAQLTEADPETTRIGALIGTGAIKITKVLGDIVLTLNMAEIFPTQAEALTGYKFTAPTETTNGSFKRPVFAPTIEKMIVIVFEGNVMMVLNQADIVATMGDFDIKTGLMTLSMACTVQSFDDGRQVTDGSNLHAFEIVIPKTT